MEVVIVHETILGAAIVLLDRYRLGLKNLIYCVFDPEILLEKDVHSKPPDKENNARGTVGFTKLGLLAYCT